MAESVQGSRRRMSCSPYVIVFAGNNERDGAVDILYYVSGTAAICVGLSWGPSGRWLHTMSPKKEKSDEEQTRDELLVRVGVRVKQLRNAAGLTQKQLAEAAEMTPAYIYLVEVGGQNITLTVLGRLAGVLGVSVVDLLQDAELGVLPADDALARLANAFQRLAGALQSRSARGFRDYGRDPNVCLWSTSR